MYIVKDFTGDLQVFPWESSAAGKQELRDFLHDFQDRARFSCSSIRTLDPRMALSSRAHAFSVEALVGKPSKRKIEDCKEEKRTNDALEQEEENVPSATIEADELG